MRRKLMAGALALTMVASLVACGGEKKAAEANPDAYPEKREKAKKLLQQYRVVKAKAVTAKAVRRSIISSDTHVWTEQTRSSLPFRIKSRKW